AADASPGADDADLRVALHVLGAGRLADVAERDLAGALGGERGLRLPIRRGLSGGEDGAGEAANDESSSERPRNRHRILPGERLERARRRALAVLERLRAWPDPASLTEHLRVFAALLEDLGYRRGVATCERALVGVETLASDLPGEVDRGGAELAQLLERAVHAAEPRR